MSCGRFFLTDDPLFPTMLLSLQASLPHRGIAIHESDRDVTRGRSVS